MTLKSKLMGAVAGLTLLSGAQAALAEAEITVAYFLKRSMPMDYGKVKGLHDEALGMKVNWVSFDSGSAMASGDVPIAVSQGVPSFVVATNAGQDIQIVDVAVSYSGNDNCVVRSDLEIDKDSAKELEDKKAAEPLGTSAHYGFLSGWTISALI